MQSITVPSVTKAPYTTHHCDLYALVGWPSLHTRQTHWLQIIFKTLLCKVPPYLSSLVNIAAPTCSTRSSRYISLVTTKNNSSFGRLSFQFSAANDWNELQKSLKLKTLFSLTSFKQQLSEQLTDYCNCTLPIYNLAKTTTSFPTVFILFIYLFCSFAPHNFLFLLCTFFHCKSTIPVFYLLYCIYFATMAFFLPLPPLPHLICSHCIYTLTFLLYY